MSPTGNPYPADDMPLMCAYSKATVFIDKQCQHSFLSKLVTYKCSRAHVSQSCSYVIQQQI